MRHRRPFEAVPSVCLALSPSTRRESKSVGLRGHQALSQGVQSIDNLHNVLSIIRVVRIRALRFPADIDSDVAEPLRRFIKSSVDDLDGDLWRLIVDLGRLAVTAEEEYDKTLLEIQDIHHSPSVGRVDSVVRWLTGTSLSELRLKRRLHEQAYAVYASTIDMDARARDLSHRFNVLHHAGQGIQKAVTKDARRLRSARGEVMILHNWAHRWLK